MYKKTFKIHNITKIISSVLSAKDFPHNNLTITLFYGNPI